MVVVECHRQLNCDISLLFFHLNFIFCGISNFYLLIFYVCIIDVSPKSLVCRNLSLYHHAHDMFCQFHLLEQVHSGVL